MTNSEHLDIKDMPEDIQHLASIVGDEKAKKICKEFGGTSIYFPAKPNKKSIINVIKKQFTGSNVNEISRLLGVSRSTIFKYLNYKEGGKNEN